MVDQNHSKKAFMTVKVEQLKITADRIANVHHLLSIGTFNLQGSAAGGVVDALEFIKQLHAGVVADVKKAESESETKPGPGQTAPGPKLASVKAPNFAKGKGKGKFKKAQAPVETKSEATK